MSRFVFSWSSSFDFWLVFLFWSVPSIRRKILPILTSYLYDRTISLYAMVWLRQHLDPSPSLLWRSVFALVRSHKKRRNVTFHNSRSRTNKFNAYFWFRWCDALIQIIKKIQSRLYNLHQELKLALRLQLAAVQFSNTDLGKTRH